MVNTKKNRQLNVVSDEYLEELENFVYESYIKPCFPQEYDGKWEILLTIRYDPKLSKVAPTSYDSVSMNNFWLLDEHYQRLVFTFEFFKIQFDLTSDFEVNKDFLFGKLMEALKDSQKSVTNCYKFRLLVKLDGDFVIQIHDIDPVDNLLSGFSDDLPPTYNVYIDKEPTMISPFTSFKTTNRSHYTESRARALPATPGKHEVLIYNPQLDVMEGSITNIAVRRKSDNKWITPSLNSGCLCGVTRHFLLRKNFLEEEKIALQDLQKNQEVLLFNGIIGVVKGTIVS